MMGFLIARRGASDLSGSTPVEQTTIETTGLPCHGCGMNSAGGAIRATTARVSSREADEVIS